ncbi:MAG: Hsp20/alpha crystallin family protein [Syntrophales bacterium]|nr:Hsp20/alpha crystallin family protein [Syntrophales bacterium]
MLESTLWRFGRFMDPFAEMMRLREQMNRIFSSFIYGTEAAFPPVNMWLGEDKVIVTAEVPGLEPENIEVTVLGDSLTIAGGREEEIQREVSYRRKERNSKRFARTFKLPFRVDSDGIEARLERGVLVVTLPRDKADMPRKINIRG